MPGGLTAGILRVPDPEQAGGAAGQSSTVEGRVQKAESAFERVLEKATGLPAGAGASDRKTATQLAELESMARKNRIQERLAAAKTNAGTK